MKPNLEISLTASHMLSTEINKMPLTPAGARSTVSIFQLPKNKKTTFKCKKCKDYDLIKSKYDKLLKDAEDLQKLAPQDSSKRSNTFRITDDTSSFLRSVSNNLFATSLINCRDLNQDLNFDSLSPEEIQTYTNNVADLIGECFDKLLSTKDYAERIDNQTRIYNLLESVKNTRFGEDAFKPILGKIKPLLKKFATVIPIEGSPQAVDDFDNNVTISEAYKALATYRPCNSQQDIEQKIMFGTDTVYRSEEEALRIATHHVHNIYYMFESDMRELLEGVYHAKSFKAGLKSFERAMWKLEEYAANGQHPTFENLGDLLRCRAAFENKDECEAAYNALSYKYTIIKMKNKMSSPLKNWTFNMIYQEMIVEVQFIYGTIASESENHKIYEIVRTRSIHEAFDVIEKWGGYHLSDKDVVKARVIDSRPRMAEKPTTHHFVPLNSSSAPKNSKLKVIRTVEYGVNNQICSYWEDEIFKSGHFKEKNEKVFRFRASSDGVLAVKTYYNADDFKNDSDSLATDILHKINDKNDFIVKVKGTFDEKKGVQSLNLTTLSGKIIQVGDDKVGKSFRIYIPDDYYVIGFGGKSRSNDKEQLLAIHCWVSSLDIVREIEAQKYCEGSWLGEKKHGYCFYEDANGDRFEGNFQNDKKHGHGIMYYFNGDIYDGEWQDDVRSGYGHMYHSTGQHYEGEWKNDQKNGVGSQVYANEDLYEGTWKDNKREGYGVFTFDVNKTKSRYEGPWKNDLQHGEGVWYTYDNYTHGVCRGKFEKGLNGYMEISYGNGSKYTGYIKEGLNNGQGIWVTPDGVEYNGEWKNGLYNGQGIEKNISGEVYEGSFADGKSNGKGKRTRQDGVLEDCEFINGVIITGYNVLWGAGGERYEGEIVNNKRDGYGKYFNADGILKYDGHWQSELRHGTGTYFFNNGMKLEGNWIYDLPHGNATLRVSETEKYKNEYYYGTVDSGKGVLFDVLGEIYIGDFKNGYLDGQVEIFDSKETPIFKGEYKQGRKNGKGTYFLCNGLKFEGRWRLNKQNGPGKLYDLDGKVSRNVYSKGFPYEGRGLTIYNHCDFYVGEYQEGMYNGEGERTKELGLTYKGTFRNDYKNGSGVLTSRFGGTYKGEWNNGEVVTAEYTAKVPKENTAYSSHKIDDNGDYFYEGCVMNGTYYYEAFSAYSKDVTLTTTWDFGAPTGKATITLPGDETLVGELFRSHFRGEFVYKSKLFERKVQYENDAPVEGYSYQMDTRNWLPLYKGDFKKNQRNGYGYLFKNGKIIFYGQFVDNKRNGFGISFDSSGLVQYVGDWKDDKKEGKGIFKLPSHGRYEGEFKNDLPHGKGTYINLDGQKFENTYSEGKFTNGTGVIIEEKGVRYEGELKNGKKQGKGAYYTEYEYNDRSFGDWEDDVMVRGTRYMEDYIYKGEWKGKAGKGNINTPFGNFDGEWDDLNGNFAGVMTYYDGSTMTSTWRKYKLTGKAIYKAADGKVYEGVYCDDSIIRGKGIMLVNNAKNALGEFVKGKLHGYGIKFDPSVEKPVYEGEWKFGDRWGHGIEYFDDGSKLEIEFISDMKHGKGTLTLADGSAHQVEYQNDKILNGRSKSTSNGFTYDGEFKNGLYHGTGTLMNDKDAIIYEGEWSEGKRHGNGTSYDLDKNTRYVGEWKNDRKDGKGTFHLNEENSFDGVYENDKLVTGKGVAFLSDGKRYEGGFVNGLFEGEGKIFDENNQEIFTGMFRDGKKNGPGTLRHDWNSYEAEYIDDRVHSGNTVVFKNGKETYRGEIKDGWWHGKGIRTSASGQLQYEGDFAFGSYEGFGCYYDMYNYKYEGSFQNGYKEGPFRIYKPSGELMIEGTFVTDVLEGYATLFFTNGETHEGVYSHGVVVDGKGIITGSRRYEGDHKDGKRHGQGCLYDDKGRLLHCGAFENGSYNGYGENYLYDNDLVSKGTFKDGNYFGIVETFFNSTGVKYYVGNYDENGNANGDFTYWTGGDGHTRTYNKGNVDDGPGKSVYANGEEFVGYFKNNKRSGKGTLKTSNGNILIGEYDNDKIKNGEGKTSDYYHEYEGGFKDGKKHGKAKVYTKNIEGLGDFSYLEGTYENGYMKYGKGITMYGDSKSCYYIGEWKDGLRWGIGICYLSYPTSLKKGEWRNDKPFEGEAIYYYENGDRYEGSFKNYRRHGPGKYVYKRGDEITGEWVDGFLHGTVTLRYPDYWEVQLEYVKGVVKRENL